MIETLVVGAWFIAGIVGIYIHELTEEHEPADVLAAIFGPITLIRAIADAVESAEQRSIERRNDAGVEQAIGEHMDGRPLEDPDAGKNPAAVALGKLGGAKGGNARAAKLSPRKRKAIAKKAAAARWKT